jgi:hypothetical protein
MYGVVIKPRCDRCGLIEPGSWYTLIREYLGDVPERKSLFFGPSCAPTPLDPGDYCRDWAKIVAVSGEGM